MRWAVPSDAYAFCWLLLDGKYVDSRDVDHIWTYTCPRNLADLARGYCNSGSYEAEKQIAYICIFI